MSGSMSQTVTVTNQMIWNAVSNGNFFEYVQAMKRGADIAYVANDGKTLLQVAAELCDFHGRIGQNSRSKDYAYIFDCIHLQLDREVIEAAKKGSAERIIRLHAAGGNLCQVEVNETPPLGVLQLAATAPGDCVGAVEAILTREARYAQIITNACNEEGTLGIHTLARDAGNIQVSHFLQPHLTRALLRCPEQEDGLEILLRLIAFGIDIHTVDNYGNTVLTYAVLNRKLSLVEELVGNQVADPLRRNYADKTAVDICNELEPREPDLDKYFRIWFLNNDLLQLMGETQQNLRVEDLKIQLMRGSDSNCKDHQGNTPVMLAVRFGCHESVIKYLVLSHSADLESVNKQGDRALELAILYGNHHTVKVLVDLGADLRRKNQRLFDLSEENEDTGVKNVLIHAMENQLMLAVQEGDESKVKELKISGVDMNAHFAPAKKEIGKGWTSFHIAVNKADDKMAMQLVECGANVDEPDDMGVSPISLATKKRNVDMVRALYSVGANINASDRNGDTPLHIAALDNDLEMVKLLILFGANEHSQNTRGQTAYDLAKNQAIQYYIRNLVYPSQREYEEQGRHSDTSLQDNDFCIPALLPDLNTQPVTTVLIGSNKANEELITAAGRGDWIGVERAIYSGGDIRYKKNGKTGRILSLEAAEKLNVKLETAVGKRRKTLLQSYEACMACASNFISRSTQILWTAVERETLEKVQSLHGIGAHINVARDPDDPLGVPGMLVRNQDSPEILSYLIQADDSRVNWNAIIARNSKGETCLSIAKEKKHEASVKLLVAVVSERLMDSVKANNTDDCKYYLEFGARPEVYVRGQKLNALMFALEHNNYKIIKMLVEAGANVMDVPLEQLQQNRNRLVVPYISTKYENERLRNAIRHRDLKAVEELHKQGAQINDRNFCGDNCVSIAVRTGYLPIVHYLVSRGGSMLHKNRSAHTNIRLSIELGNQDMVEYLRGAITGQFEDALIQGDLDELNELFSLPGFDVSNYHLSNGETPATLAVKNHGIELVQWLWKQHISLAMPNSNGDYPIGLAASCGDFAVVRFLVAECNLDKHVKNKAGRTPLALAVEAGYNIVADFLRTGQVDEQEVSEAQPKYNTRELLDAVRKSRIPIIKEFIAEVYQDRGLKIKCCHEMIQLAKRLQAEEIRVLLARHLKELQEDTSDHKLTGSKKFQKILDGLLQGLEKLVTDIEFDESDVHAMNLLTEKTRTRTKRLYEGFDSFEKMEHDILTQQHDIGNKRDGLQGYLLDANAQKQQLFKQLENSKNPVERINIRNEIKALNRQANTSQTALRLLQRKQEAVDKKQAALQKFKGHNMQQYTCFETICTKLDTFLINVKFSFSNLLKDRNMNIASERYMLNLVGKNIDCPSVGDAGFGKMQELLKALVDNALVNMAEFKDTTFTNSKLQWLVVFTEVDFVITSAAYRLCMYYRDQLNKMPADHQGQYKPPLIFGDYCTAWVAHGLLQGVFNDIQSANQGLEKRFFQAVISSDMSHGSDSPIYQYVLKNGTNPQIPLESRKTKIKKTLSEICIGGAITIPSGEMFVRVKHLSNWKDIGCYYATEDIVSNIRMFIELETINPMAVLPDPRSFVLDESGISELIGQEIGRLFEPLKADLDENAKLTEANAMDWGTAITEKVDLIEGNVMDKVSNFETIAHQHRDSLHKSISSHKQQVEDRIRQTSVEQRGFMDVIKTQFMEHKDILQNLQYQVENEEQRLESNQEAFVNEHRAHFEQYKRDVKRTFRELEEGLTRELQRYIESTQKKMGNIHRLEQEAHDALATSRKAMKLAKEAAPKSKISKEVLKKQTKLEARMAALEIRMSQNYQNYIPFQRRPPSFFF